MTGYTPKPGDRVKLRSTTWHDVIIEGERHGGYGYRLFGKGDRQGGWVSADHASFELIEAAPVPFVMGGPITREMGEPPVDSVVGFTTGNVIWMRSGSEWFAPGVSDGIRWTDFSELTLGSMMVLLRLGAGSVS